MTRRWLRSIIAHSGDPCLIAARTRRRQRSIRLARAVTVTSAVRRA